MKVHRDHLGHVQKSKLQTLIRLLALVRQGSPMKGKRMK
jgi:hypothetical protein